MKNKLLMFMLILSMTIILSLVGCTSSGKEKCDISTLDIYSSIKSIEYTGKAVYPEVHLVNSRNEIVAKIKNGYSGEDFDITYYDNINVGRAKIVIKSKAESTKYKGETFVYFDIIPSSKGVASTQEELCAILKDGTASKITLSNDIVLSSDMDISIPKDVTVYLGGHTLTNNGKINIKGTLDVNTFDKVSIINKGEICIDKDDFEQGTLLLHNGNIITSSGQIIIAGGYRQLNFPNGFQLFSDLPIKDKQGNILFDTNDFSSEKGVFVRQPLDNYQILVSKSEFVYDGSEKKPNFSVKLAGSNDNKNLTIDDYTIEYLDNINAGTATILIKATPFSRYFLGEKSVHFNIKKATIEVNSANCKELNSYLNNNNYSEIFLNCKYDKEIAIPSWAKLIVSAQNINKNITNDGILVIKPSKITEMNVGNIINDGEIDIDKSVKIIINGAMTGNGNINNYGSLYLPSESHISVANMNNLGEIYYNLDEQLKTKITGNTPNKRKKITSDNVVITNDYEIYNGYLHNINVNFLFEGNVVNVERYEYSINHTNSLIDAGEYECVLVCNDVSTLFYGETTLLYHIKKVSITIDGSGITLQEALLSQNYDNITLATNETLYAIIHIIVPQDTTVTITKDAVLYNDTYVKDGKIHTILELKGKIINNGKYVELGLRNLSFSSEVDEQISSNEIGVFVNNGEAYLNRVLPENKAMMSKYVVDYPTSIGGTTYIREHLDTASVQHIEDIPFAIKNTQGNMYVDHNKLCPDITMYAKDGTKLVYTMDELVGNEYKTIYVDYSLTYDNWRNVTMEGDNAIVIVKAANLSKKVYGKRNVNYKIVPGTVDVANYRELEWALTSVYPQSDVCNFGVVNVIADILYDGNKNTTLTVCPNTKLRCGRHRICFSYKDDGYVGTIYFCHLKNDGEVYTSGNYNKFSFYPVEGKGKYIGEIYKAGDLENLSNVQFIHIMADIDGTVNINSNNKLEYNPTEKISVYLNGHTITNLELGLAQRDIEVNGSGTINNLFIKGASEQHKHNAHLRDLQIDQIKYYSELNKQLTIIT